MTLQNISRADFCDVVWCCHACSPTNKGKQNIFDAVRKKLIDREKSRSPSWLFDCHRCWALNIKKAATCELIGAKKGAIFSLIYFFESFCLYYIQHNYVIVYAPCMAALLLLRIIFKFFSSLITQNGSYPLQITSKCLRKKLLATL